MKNTENAKFVKLGLTGAAVVAFGLIFFFIMFRAEGVSGAVRLLLNILRPFLYGAVIAYLVTPLANKLGKLFKKPEGSGLANILALLIALAIVVGILFLIIPQLVDSVTKIVDALPTEVERLEKEIEKELESDPELKEQVTTMFNDLSKSMEEAMGGGNGKLDINAVLEILNGAATTVGGILGLMKDLLIGLIVALYFLSKRRQLAAQASLMARGLFKPEWAEWLVSEVKFADRMFNGFFVGKLLDSAIVGVICFLCCMLMGFNSALLIAVIVGVTNIIPFFGPFIGAIPCALLLLLENPTHCLMFLVFVVLLQQLDGNVIGPKILGDSTGLSALWVMFGIFLFGGLWGLVGMVIGVPLMAVIYDIVRQITFRGLRRNGESDMIVAYNGKFHPPVEPKNKK